MPSIQLCQTKIIWLIKFYAFMNYFTANLNNNYPMNIINNLETYTSKQLTVHDDMGGRLALWCHIYDSEQQKIYRQIILFQRIYYLSISLTGLPCHREPSIVLMSMLEI